MSNSHTPYSTSEKNRTSKIWTFVRHEPLVHFLGIATLLFVADSLLDVDSREVITIEVATQEFLVQQQADLLLRPLSDDEKRETIESFIEDEILVREARKRGLDNSSRVRRLLIQNMRFFLAGDLHQPSEEELRAHFETNRERFETAPSATYDHVFFAEPEMVPPDTLSKLRSGVEPTTLGDLNSPFGSRLLKADRRDIAATFGSQEAPRVLAIEDFEWHGPFTSPRGSHFLRVAERHPARRPSFEDVGSWIANDWSLSKQREILDSELVEMRKSYRVEVLPADRLGE